MNHQPLHNIEFDINKALQLLHEASTEEEAEHQYGKLTESITEYFAKAKDYQTKYYDARQLVTTLEKKLLEQESPAALPAPSSVQVSCTAESDIILNQRIPFIEFEDVVINIPRITAMRKTENKVLLDGHVITLNDKDFKKLLFQTRILSK